MGCHSFVLAKKLNLLIRKHVFGSLDRRMENLFIEIQQVDGREQAHSMSLGDRVRRLELKRQLFIVRKCVGAFWRRRAKKFWVEEGDRNTNIFHRLANSRRKFHAVHCVKVNGNIINQIRLAVQLLAP